MKVSVSSMVDRLVKHRRIRRRVVDLFVSVSSMVDRLVKLRIGVNFGC